MPDILDQAARFIELGVHDLAGVDASTFRGFAEAVRQEATDSSLLVVHPSLVPASRLTPLLARDDKTGFVVADMTDVDEFAPIEGVAIPEQPLYLIDGVERGDEYANWSPDEALPDHGARPQTSHPQRGHFVAAARTEPPRRQ